MRQPLILTLLLDAVDQAFYEQIRTRYFPPERNLVPAHLTLFHHLLDEETTRQVLRDRTRELSAFPLTGPNARSIGRGVGVFFQSAPLIALHADLSAAFETHLIAQDRQRLRPHIVVQNKVDPNTARRTLEELQAEPLIEPRASGVTLWRYLEGPWEHLQDFVFGERSGSEPK